MNEQRPRGFWYVLVLMNPLNHVLAKTLGGFEGSREADAAAGVSARFWAVVLGLILLCVVAYALGSLAGVW